MFNYLLLLALVPLSMVPQLAFNIGPIPIHTLILSTAMLTVLIHYRNLFRIPRWFAYVCFGVAIFVSQLNAITVNLQSVLAEAGVWMIIPFVAVLFRHEKYRRFAVRIALLVGIAAILYTARYSSILAADIFRFGPLNWTVSGTSFLFLWITASGISLLADRAYLLVERVVAMLLILAMMYFNFFVLASRTGLIAQLVLIFLWSLLFIISRGDGSLQRNEGSASSRLGRRGVVAFLGLGLVFLLFGYQALSQSEIDAGVERRLELLAMPEEDGSLGLRLANAQKAWDLFLQSPVVGSGWGNFRYYDSDRKVEVSYRSGDTRLVGKDNINSHSTYLKVFSETGLFGSITYLSIIGWSIWQLMRLYRANPNDFFTNTPAWLWFPGYLIWSFTHDAVGYLIIYSFIIMHGYLLSHLWKEEVSVYMLRANRLKPAKNTLGL